MLFERKTITEILQTVLNGISKTLNIANQAIPIYKQVKPTINKSKQILKTIGTITTNKKTYSELSIKKEDKYNNLPSFFS
jgi:hypothetical protein